MHQSPKPEDLKKHFAEQEKIFDDATARVTARALGYREGIHDAMTIIVIVALFTSLMIFLGEKLS